MLKELINQLPLIIITILWWTVFLLIVAAYHLQKRLAGFKMPVPFWKAFVMSTFAIFHIQIFVKKPEA